MSGKKHSWQQNGENNSSERSTKRRKVEFEENVDSTGDNGGESSPCHRKTGSPVPSVADEARPLPSRPQRERRQRQSPDPTLWGMLDQNPPLRRASRLAPFRPPPRASSPPPAAAPSRAPGGWTSSSSFAQGLVMAEFIAGLGRGLPRGQEGNLLGSFCGDFVALQQAVAGARSGALPAHLLFSERDFTDEDYEMLLALDERVESKAGASQQVLDKLELVRVPRGGPECKMDCPICLETVQGGEYVRTLPCKHCFHRKCVDRWLRNKAICPVCRLAL